MSKTTITLRTSKSTESKSVKMSVADAMEMFLTDAIFKGGQVISENEVSKTYGKAVVELGGERYEFHAVAL